MILGVTGTAMPFDRLVAALDQVARRDPSQGVWVQWGNATPPDGLQGAAFLARAELLEKMRTADVVVCHAGSGTLLDAISTGHVPVVVPRRRYLGEHVNDHQLEITEALSREMRAIAVIDCADLPAAIERARGLRAVPRDSGSDRLRDALRSAAAQLGPPKRRARAAWKSLGLLTAWVPVRKSSGFRDC